MRRENIEHRRREPTTPCRLAWVVPHCWRVDRGARLWGHRHFPQWVSRSRRIAWDLPSRRACVDIPALYGTVKIRFEGPSGHAVAPTAEGIIRVAIESLSPPK